MPGEKPSAEELLGMTEGELQEQVDRESQLTKLLDTIHEASPEVVYAVAQRARTQARIAADLAIDLHTPPEKMRGALSQLTYLVTLLAKRVEADNPVKRILDPREVN